MEIHYCKQWFRYNKCPTDLLTAAQAKRRYEGGKLFTALLGSETRPHCFLEFSANRSVCVEFLDSFLRTYLVYSFQEERPEEFFLTMGVKREYLFNTDQLVRGDVYHFKVDGRVYFSHSTIDPQTDKYASRTSEEDCIDVTNNWEPYPKFGHYEGMSRINRHIPMLND